MSNEEINRKIAEVCGWVCIQCNGTGFVETYSFRDPLKRITNKCQCKYRPDYCSDLNAMHEAEKTLSGENQRREYVHCLADLMKPGEFTVLAPAHSRALAFLKTVAPKL